MYVKNVVKLLIFTIVSSTSIIRAQMNWTTLFQDNFDAGIADKWDLEPGWQIELIDQDYILSGQVDGEGRSSAIPVWKGAYNFSVTMRFKFINGDCYLYLRDGDDGTYWIIINDSQLSLNKDKNGISSNLATKNVEINPDDWHNISTTFTEDTIKVSLDNAEYINFIDSQNSVQWGSFSLTVVDDSKFFFDDIIVTGVPFKNIYVDSQNTSGNENGTIAYPFNTITEGISAAHDGDLILVAQGTYDENPMIDRKTLKIYGGYEGSAWSRDIHKYETIIDGGKRNSTLTMYSNNTTLDGFTIINGKAPIHTGGGGIHAGDGDYIIQNCSIYDNTAVGEGEWGGGGILLWNGNSQITNCKIFNNYSPHGATALRGGGVSLAIKNSLIMSNQGCAAIHLHESSGEFLNCTISDNDDKCAGANPSPIIFSNCILWNNGFEANKWKEFGQFLYCNIDENTIEESNFHRDPLFVDPSSLNYKLQLGSPCIDRGNPDARYNDTDGSRNDVGAYGGPNGISYEYIDNSPPMSLYGLVIPGFQEPGGQHKIMAKCVDLGIGIESVVAQIFDNSNNLYAQVNLFDDGSNGDDLAQDSIFTNTWTTPSTPRLYYIDIVSKDQGGFIDTLHNADYFTTDKSAIYEGLTAHESEDYFPSILQTFDGRICLFWISDREGYARLWYKYSDDSGLNWTKAQPLLNRDNCYNPAAAQTTDGTVWLFWHERPGEDIWYMTSASNGASWNQPRQFTTDPSVDENAAIATDNQNRIAVVWNSWRTGNHDIFCRFSNTNGQSWSEPIQITTDLVLDEDPSVCFDDEGRLHAAWFYSHDKIQYSTSDDFYTWTSPIFLTHDDLRTSRHAAISCDPSGQLILTFTHLEEENYNNSDIYFMKSTDGQSWSTPQKVTEFKGLDAYSSHALVDDELWMVWQSNRLVNNDIWLGKFGHTFDIDPPATAYWISHEPYSPAPTQNDDILIETLVADELGISSVELLYWIDGIKQPNIQMNDSGTSGDSRAQDYIWTASIGKHSSGANIDYQVHITDLTGNQTTSPQHPSSLRVQEPFQQSSNILLVGDYKRDYSDWILHFYIRALEANGFDYDVWDSFKRGAAESDIISGYIDGVVIWFAPEGEMFLDSLSVQQSLMAYLDNGGNLFISGQDIGSRIGDSEFYTEYLHARFVQELEDAYIVGGIDGDPISDGLNLVLFEGDGANNQHSVDEIEVVEPAVVMMHFEGQHASSGGAGIRMSNQPFSVLYLAFGFEAVNDKSIQNRLLFELLTFFDISIAEQKINYILPNIGRNHGEIYVTFLGSGFTNDMDLQLSKEGYQNIISKELIFVDKNTINVIFDLSGSAIGAWDVDLMKSGMIVCSVKRGFNIDGGFFKLWADIVGRNELRPGRESSFFLTIGNSGNSTVEKVILNIELPPDITILGLYHSNDDSSLVNPDTLETYDIHPDILPIWISELAPNQSEKFRIDVIVPVEVLRKESAADPPRIGVTGFVLGSVHEFARSSLDALQDDNNISPTEWVTVLNRTSKSMAVSLLQTVLVNSIVTLASPEAAPFISAAEEAYAWTTLTIAIAEDYQAIKKYINKQTDLSMVNSLDPNEKVGSEGLNFSRAISTDELVNYIVYFENVDSATAAAQEIQIIDTLDINLDPSSYYFGDVKLGKLLMPLPDSSKEYSKKVNLNDTTDIEIEIKYEETKRILKWHFKGKDLVFGGWGDILPPNKVSPEGEGFVSFSIKPKQKLISGTTIRNSASIIFDLNKPIITNEVFNTLDSKPPQSYVKLANQSNDSSMYEIQWYGIDDSLGSGVKDFSVLYSENGSSYIEWHTNFSDTFDQFLTKPGTFYRFYSIARDSTGNTETQPDSFDISFYAYPTGVTDRQEVPLEFDLGQNYPNPFNPITNLKYQVPKTCDIKIEIYNILGQRVKTLIDTKIDAGYHKAVWNGANEYGLPVATGVYICRFVALDYQKTIKMLVLR